MTKLFMKYFKRPIVGCGGDVLRVFRYVHAHNFAIVSDCLQRLPKFAPKLKRKI
jgi:hypothetical protein